MTALLQLSGRGSLHRQIYEALRAGILAGRLKPDSRLPSTRELARELGVSRNVVLLAYEILVDEGYAEGRVGSGTYVGTSLPEEMLTADRRGGRPEGSGRRGYKLRLSAFARRLPLSSQGTTSSDPGDVRYDFRYGFADEVTLPLLTWRRLVGRRSREPSLNYGAPEGTTSLRTSVAEYLTRARAITCTPEQVIIVAGSQQGLDLVARVLLDPGDQVVIEEPHYRGARDAFLAAGAILLGVGVDEQGLEVDRLPRRNVLARLAYVTPSHQFPTGGILSLSRRLELLSWASKVGAYVLEDDYDGEYRYDARPLEALQGLDRSGRVIYLGTFSKVLFPALRLGYLVLPEPLLPYFRAAKALADRHTPQLLQEVMADFLNGGHFERYLRRSRLVFAARRGALLAALESELGDRVQVQGANAGVHVVVWLEDLGADRIPELIERAAAAGVGVESVDHCYTTPPERAGLLLGYQALDEGAIAAAVRLLAGVLREMSLQ